MDKVLAEELGRQMDKVAEQERQIKELASAGSGSVEAPSHAVTPEELAQKDADIAALTEVRVRRLLRYLTLTLT